MKRPKLIGTDLDGTIVPFDRPISQRTIDAFTHAHRLGIEIFFVTGRPPRWMKPVQEAFNFGTGICGNGALLYDFRDEKIIDSWLIGPEELTKGAAKLRKVIPGATFAVENFDGFHRERTYNPRWDKGQDDLGVSMIEEHLSQPAIKFLVRCQGEEISADEIDKVIKKLDLKSQTDRTITSEKELLSAITRAKKIGFAIDDQENELGSRCVAVAITDKSEKALCALSITGPASRMSTEKIRVIGESLKLMAKQLNTKLK